MAKNTSTTDALSKIDMFAGLSKKELVAIDRLMTPITIKAGRNFITEGSVGREAFIITDGTASVWRHGKLIASVGVGAVMGELALLAGTARTATVKAETDVTVEVLNRGEFHQLLDESSGMARKLLTATISRLQQLEPSLLS